MCLSVGPSTSVEPRMKDRSNCRHVVATPYSLLPEGRGTLATSQSNIETTSEAALPDLERRVLRILCSGKEEAHELARRGLAGYRWRDPTHEAIFEAIMSFPSASSQTLREQLPARLTRRGFPDFDFESLFESSGFAAGEFEQLIGKLRGEERA